MSTRAAAWLAWSLCLLCVALAVASLILALLNGRTLGEIFMPSGPSIVTLATLVVSFSVVGALIASHRSENLIGWIFLAVGFLYGLLRRCSLWSTSVVSPRHRRSSERSPAKSSPNWL